MGSAWIYKSGVADILSTSPLLTFAIKIPLVASANVVLLGQLKFGCLFTGGER
jgi:hypothetical protein